VDLPETERSSALQTILLTINDNGLRTFIIFTLLANLYTFKIRCPDFDKLLQDHNSQVFPDTLSFIMCSIITLIKGLLICVNYTE
jgi:hypothetical protein